ncbi:MAG TPA: ankyrin repeat domain-containing protein, partial [Verrucomicrobiae bacterium]|nr:ankyrin repeat domain-containing protein [Verrucomicrobiae bacterium]
LHLASAGHRFDIVRELLAAGADANSAANHRLGAPLHYAADTCPDSATFSAANQIKTLSVLIGAGAKMNAADKNGATALHRAVRTRGAEAVKFLLKSGAHPLLENISGSTPFHLAVQNTGRGGSGSQAARRAQREIIEMFMALDVDAALKRSVIERAQSPWIQGLLR